MTAGGIILSRINRAALAAFLFLAGCGRAQFAPVPAPCPAPPVLPKVAALELQALSDDVYRRLVERELRLKAYIGQLRAVCEEDR